MSRPESPDETEAAQRPALEFDREPDQPAADESRQVEVPEIQQTMYYVPTLARRYIGRGMNLDELVAAGNLGLVEAALRFDPARNVRFTTYANWWIRKTILEAMGQQCGPMRLPRYQYDRLKSLREARADWVGRHGETPSTEELARSAGLSPAEVSQLEGVVTGAVSLEQPLSSNDSRPVKETLADPDAESPHRTLLRRDMRRRLRERLTQLAERERQVIAMRFGLADGTPKTLRETGRTLGISRERVRQVEIRALLKLRQLI